MLLSLDNIFNISVIFLLLVELSSPDPEPTLSLEELGSESPTVVPEVPQATGNRITNTRYREEYGVPQHVFEVYISPMIPHRMTGRVLNSVAD